MKDKSSKLSLITTFFLGGLTGIYVILKASSSSFTHDESFSYLHYPQDSFIEIISFKNWFMNNHIMNSLLMKYSEMFFGNTEIALRLPNILLLFVYMIYCYRIFKEKGAVLRITSFIILCTNVLLIDLFGLARGYGLSYGFMIMSLFYFFSHLRKPSRINLYLFHFSALCAILSHFTLLTFYVSSLIIIVLINFFQIKSSNSGSFNLFKSHKQHILPFLFNVIVLYEPARRAIKYGQLDVGGRIGFYSDSLSSFLSNTFYEMSSPYWIDISLKVLLTLIVIAPLYMILRKYFSENGKHFKDHIEFMITTFLLTLIPTIIVFNHLVLGSDYPVGRFLVFLIPLFWIHFCLFIDFISKSYKVISLVMLVSIGLMSSITFITKSNFATYGEWGYDAQTKTMIEDLIDYRKANNINREGIKVGINWLFEPTANYYRKVNKLTWLLPFDRNGISTEDHFIYTFKESTTQINRLEYELFKEYKTSNTVLFKKKSK